MAEEHVHAHDADEGEEHQHVEQYLLDGAQLTVAVLVAGTVGYLKERGLSPAGWAEYIGEHFAGSWEAFVGAGADETLENVLPLQVESLGAELIEGVGDTDHAEVAVGQLPNRELLAKFGTTPRTMLRDFGITQKDFNVLYDTFKPAAAAAGFRFTHHPSKGRHVIVLSRRTKRSTGG